MTAIAQWAGSARRFQARHPPSNGPAAQALSLLIPEGGDQAALLRQKYGERAAGELLALARESNQEMLMEGLLVFGRRLEEGGQAKLAAEVYGAVAVGAGLVPARGPAQGRPLQEIQQEASRQLAALEGKDSAFGLRAEVLGRNLIAGGLDYRLIGFMMFGSGLFQATKSLALVRLWARPVTGFWSGVLTRGAGASLTSAAAGLAVQAPATSLLSRSWLAASGETVDWNPLDIAKEAAVIAVAQSVMSFSGWLGSKASGAAFLQPTASFFGLFGARALEIGVGLRPHEKDGTLFADTFAEWIGLSVGARLGFGILGPSWGRFQRDLALRGKHRELARPAIALPQTASGGASPSPANMVFSKRWSVGRALERLERMVRLADITPPRNEVTHSPLKHYPKLLSSLRRAEMTLEQGEDLFALVVQRAGKDGPRASHGLSAAVNAMARLGFSFEQMRSLLEAMGKEGEGYSLVLSQIPFATRILRKLAASREAKHRFLVDIGKKAGSQADLVYANLGPPVKIMSEDGWSLAAIQEMIFGILEHSQDQIWVALGNFDAAFAASREESWVYRDKIRLYSLLAQPAEDSQTMAWRFHRGFPRAIEAMKASGWESDDRFDTLLTMLETTDIDTALKNFPKAVYSLDLQDWPSAWSISTLQDIFRSAGRRAGHFLWCLPQLSLALALKGHVPLAQREMLHDFAAESPRMNVLDLAHLAKSQELRLNEKKN